MNPARRYALVFWLLWFAIAVLFAGQELSSDRFAIAGGVGSYGLPIVVYLWCKADSARRSVVPPPGAIPLLAVLLPIGWIYYVFGTRRPFQAVMVVAGTLFSALLLVAIVLFIRTGGHVAT